MRIGVNCLLKNQQLAGDERRVFDLTCPLIYRAQSPRVIRRQRAAVGEHVG